MNRECRIFGGLKRRALQEEEQATQRHGDPKGRDPSWNPQIIRFAGVHGASWRRDEIEFCFTSLNKKKV